MAAEAMLDAIVCIDELSGFFRVAQVSKSDLVLIRAEVCLKVPLNAVHPPDPCSVLLLSPPWQRLITKSDISRFLFQLERFDLLSSNFEEQHFFHVALPALDRHFGSNSAEPAEAMQSYYSSAVRLIKHWLQRDELATYHSIIFHIIKKLFAAAALRGYGDGYHLSRKLISADFNATSFPLILTQELASDIEQFLARENTSLKLAAELFDQLVPSLHLRFRELIDAFLARFLSQIKEHTGHDANDKVLDVLVQIANISKSHSSADIVGLVFSALTRSLHASGSEARQKAIAFILPVIYSWCQISPELAPRFPLAEMAASLDGISPRFQHFMLVTLLNSNCCSRLEQFPDFTKLLDRLFSIEVLAQIFEQSKWQVATQLLKRGFRLSRARGNRQLAGDAVAMALSHCIPVDVLPIIDEFRVEKLLLHAYLSSLTENNKRKALRIVCVQAKTWYSTLSLLEDYPALLAFCKLRLSYFALVFTRKHSSSAVSRLPRLLTLHIVEYLS